MMHGQSNIKFIHVDLQFSRHTVNIYSLDHMQTLTALLCYVQLTVPTFRKIVSKFSGCHKSRSLKISYDIQTHLKSPVDVSSYRRRTSIAAISQTYCSTQCVNAKFFSNQMAEAQI